MVDFGLSEAEFWRLTPREYGIMKRRFEASEERKDYRAALITSWVANSIPSKRKRPYKPDDFMPRRRAAKQAHSKATKPQGTPAGEAVYNRLSSAMRVLGGRKGRAETPEQKKYRIEAIERYRNWKTSEASKEETNG